MIDLAAYVSAYLTSTGSGNWSVESFKGALAAEQASQRKTCTVPTVHDVTATTTLGSAVVVATEPMFSGYDAAGAITGTGIPDATIILSVDSPCQITLSTAATADGTDVTLTVDPDSSDLAEALARRVATNLANRNLPLGVQTQVAEFGSLVTRVGGRDREVMRLEGPYRIIPAG